MRDGVLTDARLPTMYRIDVDGLRIDRAGMAIGPYAGATLVAAGQRIGLGHESWQPPAPRRWVLSSDAGGEMELETRECPAGASCIAGFMLLKTGAIVEGDFRVVDAPPELASVVLKVSVESRPERWPPPCCIGDPVNAS